jgi:hypothetical protein
VVVDRPSAPQKKESQNVVTVKVDISDSVFAFLREPSDAASPAVVVRLRLASCTAQVGAKIDLPQVHSESAPFDTSPTEESSEQASSHDVGAEVPGDQDSTAISAGVELQGLEVFSNSSASASSGVQILRPVNISVRLESSNCDDLAEGKRGKEEEEEEEGHEADGQHTYQLNHLAVAMDEADVALSFRDIALLSAIARHAVESTANLGGPTVDAGTAVSPGTHQFDRQWAEKYANDRKRCGLPITLNSHACDRPIVDICLLKGKHSMPPTGYHKCQLSLSSSTLPKGRLLYLCYAFASSCVVATAGPTVMGSTARCPPGTLLNELEPLQDVVILTEEKGARSTPPVG